MFDWAIWQIFTAFNSAKVQLGKTVKYTSSGRNESANKAVRHQWAGSTDYGAHNLLNMAWALYSRSQPPKDYFINGGIISFFTVRLIGY